MTDKIILNTQKKVDRLILIIARIRNRFNLNKLDGQVIGQYLNGDIDYHTFTEYFDNKILNGI